MNLRLPERRPGFAARSAGIRAWLLVLLMGALACRAQVPQPAPSYNATVSPAEVTAFMQSVQKDPKGLLKIESNPKRVPLLLGAMKRDPAGPWVRYLQAFGFQVDRAATWGMAEERRNAVYAWTIVYLSAAKETTTQALATNRQNAQLLSNLKMIEQSLAQAYAESAIRTNKNRATSSLTATNSTLRTGSTPKGEGTARNQQICSRGLRDIEAAKQMWAVDENKPPDAAPTAAEITKYFPYRIFPKCPDGGTYTIGRLKEKPRCSVPGHALPISGNPF